MDSGNHSSEEELEEIYKAEPAAATKAGPPIPTAVASAEVHSLSGLGSILDTVTKDTEDTASHVSVSVS